jgi:hypothetical protein
MRSASTRTAENGKFRCTILRRPTRILRVGGTTMILGGHRLGGMRTDHV